MSIDTVQHVSLDRVYRIFCAHAHAFFGVLFVSVVGAVVLWFVQPVGYTVHVLLDVARMGRSTQTQDYTYDEYYRLQADEQFGETVAHWMQTPRVVDDILQTAAMPLPDTLRERERFFRAHRISPQSIAVTYDVVNPLIGTRVANAISKQLNARVASLNYAAAQEQWFVVQVSEPVMARNHKPLWLALIGGGVAGMFAGSALVLVLHAVRKERRTEKK